MERDQIVCNTCKQNVAASNYSLHSIHCERFLQFCTLCQEPVPRNQYEVHVEQMHVEVSCDSCGKTIQKYLLEEHRENDCSKREVSCSYCEIHCIAEKLDEHENVCGSRTEKCETCDNYILVRMLKQHAELHKKPMPNSKEIVNRPPSPSQSSGSKSEVSERTEVCETFLGRDNRRNKDVQEHAECDVSKVSKRNTIVTQCIETNKVPCEFCQKLIPFDLLLTHMQNCSQQVQLLAQYLNDTLEIERHRKQFTTPGVYELLSIPCEFCGVLFPKNKLEMHEWTCSKPISVNGAEKPKNVDDGSEETKPDPKEREHIGANGIPCEFCQKPIPFDLLQTHTEQCTVRIQLLAQYLNDSVDNEKQAEQFFEGEQELLLIPCEFCGELLPQDRLEMHEWTCSESYSTNDAEQSAIIGDENKVTKRNTTQKECIEIKKVPCEYCQKPITFDLLQTHVQKCTVREQLLALFENEKQAKQFTVEGEQIPLTIPCELCGELFPIDRIEVHERTCSEPYSVNDVHQSSFTAYLDEDIDQLDLMVNCSVCNERIPLRTLDEHEYNAHRMPHTRNAVFKSSNPAETVGINNQKQLGSHTNRTSSEKQLSKPNQPYDVKQSISHTKTIAKGAVPQNVRRMNERRMDQTKSMPIVNKPAIKTIRSAVWNTSDSDEAADIEKQQLSGYHANGTFAEKQSSKLNQPHHMKEPNSLGETSAQRAIRHDALAAKEERQIDQPKDMPIVNKPITRNTRNVLLNSINYKAVDINPGKISHFPPKRTFSEEQSTNLNQPHHMMESDSFSETSARKAIRHVTLEANEERRIDQPEIMPITNKPTTRNSRNVVSNSNLDETVNINVEEISIYYTGSSPSEKQLRKVNQQPHMKQSINRTETLAQRAIRHNALAASEERRQGHVLDGSTVRPCLQEKKYSRNHDPQKVEIIDRNQKNVSRPLSKVVKLPDGTNIIKKPNAAFKNAPSKIDCGHVLGGSTDRFWHPEKKNPRNPTPQRAQVHRGNHEITGEREEAKNHHKGARPKRPNA